MLRIDFVTLFPEMVLGAMDCSMMQRAQEAGLAEFGAVNPRDFTHDKHRSVDDDPYGGGAGMVMMCEPVWDAVESLGVIGNVGQGAEGTEGQSDEGTGPQVAQEPANKSQQSKTQNPKSIFDKSSIAIVLPDPTGRLFKQQDAKELAAMDRVVFLCGHYEGIDDRIRTLLATHVFSLGDFVLTGGELPALVMADAVVRLIPGVLGCEGSLEQDSFSDGLLSAPQFTRPESFRGAPIPDVLKTGDHGAIAKWRRREALLRTRQNRPDLFWRARLEKADPDMLSF